MKARSYRPLSAEIARALFNYDPGTGFLTAKSDFNQWKKGQRLGYLKKIGYRVLTVGGVNYLEHHIIWLWMTGAWPASEIDHRDLDRANNCFNNLRECSSGQNLANRRVRPDNRSTVKGVKFINASKKYVARIMKDGKNTHLGTFDTAKEAGEAYQSAAERLYGEFARCS